VIELSEQTIIDQVADRLTRKYPTIPPDTVAAVVQGVHARFNGRPVREYVPLLVERFAGKEVDRLRLAACSPVSEATVERDNEAVEFTSLSVRCHGSMSSGSTSKWSRKARRWATRRAAARM
jgi:hypothetical protein